MSMYHRPRAGAAPWSSNEPAVASQRVAYPAATNQAWNMEDYKLPLNSQQVYQPYSVPIQPPHIPRTATRGDTRAWPSNVPYSYVQAPNYLEPPTKSRKRSQPQASRAPYYAAPPEHYTYMDQSKPSAHRSSARISSDREGAPLNPGQLSEPEAPKRKPRPDIQELLKTSFLRTNVISLTRGKKSKKEATDDPLPASRGRTDHRTSKRINTPQVPPQAQADGQGGNMSDPMGRHTPQSGQSLRTKFSNWLFSSSRDSSREGSKGSKLVPRRWSNSEQLRPSRNVPVPNPLPAPPVLIPQPVPTRQRSRSRSASRERGKLVKEHPPTEDRRNNQGDSRQRTYSSSSRNYNTSGVPETSAQGERRQRRSSNADRYREETRAPIPDPRRDYYPRRISSDNYVRDSRDPMRDGREAARNTRESTRDGRARSRSRERNDGRESRVHPPREERHSFNGPVIAIHSTSVRPASSASRSGRNSEQPLPMEDPAHRPRRASVSSIQNHGLLAPDAGIPRNPRSRTSSRASASEVPVIPNQPRSRAGSRVSASDVPIIAPAPRPAVIQPPIQIPNQIPLDQPPSSRRRPSISRSRSRDEDPLTRQNTLHNARNLTYHPETDGEVGARKSSFRKITSNMDSLPYHLGGTADVGTYERGYNSDITRMPKPMSRRYSSPVMPRTPADPQTGYGMPIPPNPVSNTRPPLAAHPGHYSYQPDQGRWFAR